MGAGSTLKDLIMLITNLIGAALPLAVALGLLGFFWGIFRAFGSQDDAEKRKEGYEYIVWSLLAIIVVVSIGGIINVLQATFFQGVAL